MTRSEVVLRNKDVLAGLLFLIMAGVVAFGASRLPMGTSVRMGAGYFPTVLAGILALLGALTVVNGFRNASPDEAVHSMAWSRLAIVTLAVLLFVFGLERLGFPLTVAGTTFIAATGSRVFRLLPSLLLALFVSALSWVLFVELLSLPFQATGTWLAGS